MQVIHIEYIDVTKLYNKITLRKLYNTQVRNHMEIRGTWQSKPNISSTKKKNNFNDRLWEHKNVRARQRILSWFDYTQISLFKFVSHYLHVTSFHVSNGDCPRNCLVLGDVSVGETNAKMMPETPEHPFAELGSAKTGSVTSRNASAWEP